MNIRDVRIRLVGYLLNKGEEGATEKFEANVIIGNQGMLQHKFYTKEKAQEFVNVLNESYSEIFKNDPIFVSASNKLMVRMNDIQYIALEDARTAYEKLNSERQMRPK